jgi:glycosyl hydrolase family 10
MKYAVRIAILSLAVWVLASAQTGNNAGQNWTNYVRIGGYALDEQKAKAIVQQARESDVFGIEVDNDIPGRYESFLDPTEKLKAIRAIASEAHKAGNHAFVYIAGTECITSNADKTSHTMAKDHPDWLQRKKTGEPAVFGGGSAFWIHPGDEDVWISPFATEWRKIYMERVRQIAGTGIDGIYIDIPYWMTHFDGWEDTWASFDDYTVEAFKQQTGLDAKTDVKVGDFGDANFRRWVDFRIQAITDFLKEIDKTAKSVNPEIKTIPEIYPGIEREAVVVGSDVYNIYPVVDAIAHEYEFGGGDHMASSRKPLDWFLYQVGMHSFRAFAEGKATWILNYSWDGDKKVDKREAMMNLAMSQVMAGANFWDAPGHVMAGSNDMETRKKIFSWIHAHEKTFYAPRSPIDPVGVYFSPKTRDYGADEFIQSYRGVLILLMQAHREFQIVTPRTLAAFRGKTLVLPDVRVLDDHERKLLREYIAGGKKLAITGTDATQLDDSPGVMRFAQSPGKEYMSSLGKDFARTTPQSEADFLSRISGEREIEIQASAHVATSIAQVDGKTHIYFANFAGLVGGANPVQTPQRGVKVITASKLGGKGFFLPFLGETEPLHGQQGSDGRTTYTLPPITRAAVFWYEQ